MLFGLTRGEITLVIFIFGLVYGAGLLPKLTARFGGAAKADGKAGGKPGATDD